MQLEAAKAARAATERALEGCRSELAVAAAKAADAADDAAKWQGTAAALERQLQRAEVAAGEAAQEAQALREEAESREHRIAEMRSALASGLDEHSAAAAQQEEQLAAAQQACQVACARTLLDLRTSLAVLAAEQQQQAGVPEAGAAALAACLQAAEEGLQGLPPLQHDMQGCLAALGGALEQLAGGYCHLAAMVQERRKVRWRGGSWPAAAAPGAQWQSRLLPHSFPPAPLFRAPCRRMPSCPVSMPRCSRQPRATQPQPCRAQSWAPATMPAPARRCCSCCRAWPRWWWA